MPKLNQILAVVKGVQNRTNIAITEAHHATQRTDAVTGLSRTYKSIDDEGEVFPPESKRVTVTVVQELERITKSMITLIDVTATRDEANNHAKADVKVDDLVIAKFVPAVTLLWLEKQMVDLKTIISKLPVLDAAERWSYDANVGAYVTEAVQTHKSKKVPKVLVKYDATKEHPAQTEVITEDVVVGYWTITKSSGAIPFDEKALYLQRVDELLQAVQTAREEANLVEAPNVELGKSLLDYVFAGQP